MNDERKSWRCPQCRRADRADRFFAGFGTPERLKGPAIVSEVTRILEAAQRGNPSAADELLPLRGVAFSDLPPESELTASFLFRPQDFGIN
jgi:hypothetical protein